jgi:hypothetical protein
MSVTLFLWDTKKKVNIKQLYNGDIVDRSTMPTTGWSIRVLDNSLFKSVEFVFDDNVLKRLEQYAPYIAMGDDVDISNKLKDGQHTLVVTPCTNIDGSGRQTSEVFVFTVCLYQPEVRGVVGFDGTSLAQIATLKNDLKISAVRPWLTPNWSRPPTIASFTKYKAFHDAGIKICPVWHTNTVPTYDQAKNFFSKAAEAANGCIDYWEIINEPNLSIYWPANYLPQYVKQCLKGAYDALNPLGQKVVGAPLCSMGIVHDTISIKILKDNGYLDYCHIPGFHAYGETEKDHIDRARNAASLFGKRIFQTEWNLHGGGSSETPQSWSSHFQKMLDGTRDILYGYLYYRIKPNTQNASKASILKADWTPNEPFYSAIKNLH